MQARNWCFTAYNDPSAVDWDNVRTLRYCVYQHEVCPETQRDHWQGYLEFTVPKRMAELKVIMDDKTVHFETRKGTRQQARAYCMKAESRAPDEEPVEYGEWTGGQERSRNDLTAAKKLISESSSWTAVMNNPELTPVIARYGRWAREVYDNRPLTVAPLPITLYAWQEEAMELLEGKHSRRQVIWIWSEESGTGKSTFFDYCSSRWNILPAVDYVNTLYAYDGHYCIWFDISRDQSGKEVPYHAIEKLSNGGFHLSTKYTSCRKLINCHIVVTANCLPCDHRLPDRCTVILANKIPPAAPTDAPESPARSPDPPSEDLYDSE